MERFHVPASPLTTAHKEHFWMLLSIMRTSTLVPIMDDASVADSVEFAHQLLGKELGQVTLLRTYLDLLGVDPVLTAPTPGLHDIIGAQTRAQAEVLQNRLPTLDHPVEVAVSYGQMASEVDRLTASHGFTWVVVGSGPDHDLFKEGAGAVVGAAHVPVLVIPFGAAFRPLRTILLADDDGEISPASLSPLLAIARTTGAEVLLLRVRPPGEPDTTVNGSRTHHALLGGIPHAYLVTHSDDVAQAISEQAVRSNAQLIVLLHRHRGLLGGIFHHSIARELANDTALPLLVLEQ